jgi:dienelactone hydrolase
MILRAACLATLLALSAVNVAHGQTVEPAICATDIEPAATVEVSSFQTRRRPIETLVVRPTGPANGAAIVILHGAGGLHSDLPRYETQAYQLASRGYHVVMPNYYSASNRSFRESPLITERWRQVADDAVAFAGGLPGVSPDRVGIWGYSLGGFLAIDSTLDGGPARAVIAVGAGGRAGRLGGGRHPSPVLMIAGDQDPVVPITAVNEWADSLRARDVPVSVETLDTAKHFFDPPTWCEVFQHTRTFFDRQLLPAAG